MKKLGILILSIILISNVVCAAGTTPEALFSKANEYYNSKKYAEALVLYNKIIKSGFHSAEIYYNTGNAYYKSGNYPYAILFYEKAKLLDPSNEDIEFNLAKARTFVIDKIEAIPEFFIISWFEGFVFQFSSNTWAMTGIILFIISIFLLSGFFVLNSRKIKKLIFVLSVFLLLLTFFSVSFAFKTRKHMLEPGTAIIVTPTISVKASPDYEAIDVFLLHEGSKVFLVRKLGNWYEIKLTDGKQGWLESTAIEKI